MHEQQLELGTVIDHVPFIVRGHTSECSSQSPHDRKCICAPVDTHIPPGIRLDKLLNKYDSSPSSDLWRDIQSLAREILK